MKAHVRAWLPVVLAILGAAAFLVYGSIRTSATPRLSTTVETKLGSGFVARVVDGDTLTLDDGRRIRLVQIDAPEVAEGECYAEQAKHALETLTPAGAQVAPELDAALDLRDEHGRLLAYVFEHRVNVNLRLVEVGAAAPYFYRGERGRFAAALLAAAKRARAAGRGLWGACPDARLDPGHRLATGP